MAREFRIGFFANGKDRAGGHGYSVMETVLYKCVSGEDGKRTAQHRTIFQVVWRRRWPFTTCRVKFKNGDVVSCASSFIVSPFRKRMGVAVCRALERAGFEIETSNGPLAPHDVCMRRMSSLAKSIGRMFAKDDEFVACRKFCF